MQYHHRFKLLLINGITLCNSTLPLKSHDGIAFANIYPKQREIRLIRRTNPGATS